MSTIDLSSHHASKINLEKDKAEIQYTTRNGKVKLSFYQKDRSKSRFEEFERCEYLVVDIKARSKFGFSDEDVASASVNVYHEYSDGRNNVMNVSGSTNFWHNLETAKIEHANPEITKLIKRAQHDIAKTIPAEKEKLKLLAKQKEEKDTKVQKEADKRKKENAILQKMFNSSSVGR